MTLLRRGWLHLASGAGLGRIFGFVSNLLLSRWLGPSDLGLFNLVSTTVQTTDTVVRCGGDYALNFELGGNPEGTKTQRGSELVRGFTQLCTIATITVCIAIAIWISWANGLWPLSLPRSQRLGLTVLLLLMIVCEGCSSSAWEVLLASHRTASLALRQGLFFPLRLVFAAAGALSAGVVGAMGGWSIIAVIQCLWLKAVLGETWRPLYLFPPLFSSLQQLLRRGFPFYAANLLASLIFFPLLLKVASDSGLSQIGYLRVGQILQQLFAFLPATLVPVLFLRLRGESSFLKQVLVMEKPLRIIWLLLLEVLLLYCTFDESVVPWLFGIDFISAISSTRLLLVTALFESLSQLLVQPLLAAGHTRLYGLWQNGAALLAAILGWIWIPKAGLAAYLIVRLIYVVIPLFGYGMPVFKAIQNPTKIIGLLSLSLALMALFLVQSTSSHALTLMPIFYAVAFILIAVYHRDDLLFLRQLSPKRP